LITTFTNIIIKRSGAVVLDFGQEFTNVQGLQNFLGTLDAKSRYLAQMHVLNKAREKRNRKAEAKKTILNAWGNEAAAFIGSTDSCTMLSVICKGCQQQNYRATMLQVSEEIVKRMTGKASGVSSKCFSMTRDFEFAHKCKIPLMTSLSMVTCSTV
jgi:hypothetical protein